MSLSRREEPLIRADAIGKEPLKTTVYYESRIAELESILRRARAVIPDEYEDEIEVRAAINRYLNA